MTNLPDFSAHFFKRLKNQKSMIFDGVKAFAGIYNIRLDMSVLEKYSVTRLDYWIVIEIISQEYKMLQKLDLTSNSSI